MLYLSNCLIRCVCKKSLLSFSYFSMVIKKNMQNQNKFVGNSLSLAPPPPPSATVYVLQYSSFWNRKAKKLWDQNYKLCPQNYKLRPQNYKLRSQKLQVTPTKLQATLAKLQVTPTKLQVTLTKLQVTSTKLTSYAFKTYKFDSWN